ncbi:DNA-processing protein DprA [Hoyosella sp. YIM 151337]|uniref:DNA-processing protein DprA n=1 Tax=Hoyosella sp. YIM 151337 TaxID=2992742 RepID=UPI002235CECC|nr:DNA-processing protein DprA [Hoyosella sp. YIM 151337]MCW4353939.1 DNA-processing protein DprA [Hoyosella sp. YIM 151337]
MTNRQDSRDPRLRAWAYLSRVVEGPSYALSALIAQIGPEDAAAAVRTAALPEVLDRQTAARRQHDNSARDLEILRELGGTLVTPDSSEWPHWRMLALDQPQCREVASAAPPIALWKRGPLPLDELTSTAVSVVGTRAPSSYGEHSALTLSADLAAAGCTIISGAAHGIDGCAHRAALSRDAPTVAVLACGIDMPYPSTHAALINEIARRSAVVTEYPPGTSPARFRFLARNRLVAAFSDAVVVVEAGKRSGARNTAKWGRLYGRRVFAVPGPITSVSSVGCHQMIRLDEAVIATSAADVLTDSGLRERDLQRALVAADETDSSAERTTDGLTPPQLQVFDSLPLSGGADVSSIAGCAGLPPTTVRAAIAVLEMSGFAIRTDGGWRRKKLRESRAGR